MIDKLKRIGNLVSNMGWRYVSFRAYHEITRRSGMLKKKFPTNPAFQQHFTLTNWKKQTARFFFEDRESLIFPKNPSADLKKRFDEVSSGKLLFFSSTVFELGKNYDWVTNPDTGYKYDVNKHWTEIPDYSKEAGDIKYVWEKSRFSYLYDIIRYDYHYGVDCAQLVFNDILSWIKANPINCGPNYRCSQEMSIRVLNWTFALHYYKNSAALTEDIFNHVQHVIYWHLHHIYNNIHFSRIAVRNNHAITETLTLYLGGLLYPDYPDAAKWKEKGKKWFEEEIAYQVYEDGTFLQYSMNYHRVVAQLMTWAIALSDQNKERFEQNFYKRAKRTFLFLRTCMNEENGWLPNYGANDGALFFRLSSTDYRDYRPQLQALAAALGTELKFNQFNEDSHWYGTYENARKTWEPQVGLHEFKEGGYYIIKEKNNLTFLKCGSYKDRPQHADNLHIDIWHNGENLIMDGGSYKYNTDNDTIRFFSGTESHNTVMLGDKDQMLKGGRFIWYYWTQCKNISFKETDSEYIFEGSIEAFRYLSPGIVHTRKVVKTKGSDKWLITDSFNETAGLTMRQLWHMPTKNKNKVTLKAKVGGKALKGQEIESWASPMYGMKEKNSCTEFSTDENTIETELMLK